MPQMGPLNWTSLLIMFSLTLAMFMLMNYFSFKNEPMDVNKSIKTNKINWKW